MLNPAIDAGSTIAGRCQLTTITTPETTTIQPFTTTRTPWSSRYLPFFAAALFGALFFAAAFKAVPQKPRPRLTERTLHRG
jgi:hypothetical protein